MVEIKTTEMKEKMIQPAIDNTKLEQVIYLPQTERETEDVWFVLLDAPDRESMSPIKIKSINLPPGMELLVITGVFCNSWHWCPYSTSLLCLTIVDMAEYPAASSGESIPVVTQSVLSKMEVVVEEVVVQKGEMIIPKSADQEVKQSFSERSDDWFLLWDNVLKETAYVAPGIHCLMSLLQTSVTQD